MNIKLITVGFTPAWDITCRVDGVDWGQHPVLSGQTTVPAGKALNVARAMAYMGKPCTAMGLWGRDDAKLMRQELAGLQKMVNVRFTLAEGRTRQNITIIDTRNRREMHLRGESRLAAPAALAQLAKDLNAAVGKGDQVAFCGAMPGNERLADCLAILRQVRDAGAAVIIDSSGDALKRIVAQGGLYLIKPNLDELCQLLDRTIPDQPSAIAAAAQTLCDRVKVVLVSRGKNGAMAVTERSVCCAAVIAKQPAINTVGCGDYLLAGFLAADTDNIAQQLAVGVKLAAARACGLTETHTWQQVQTQLTVKTESL